jgi:hypothetical protein
MGKFSMMSITIDAVYFHSSAYHDAKNDILEFYGKMGMLLNVLSDQ